MGLAYICMDVIYDFAEVLTKILTCGKCKVGGYLPPLSHNNHHCHRPLHHQSPGRTAVAQLSLLLCLVSSLNSCSRVIPCQICNIILDPLKNVIFSLVLIFYYILFK